MGRFDENAGSTIDPRLEAIVDRMFERCLVDRRYKQAVGVALETRRVDILERAIHEAVSALRHVCMRTLYWLVNIPPSKICLPPFLEAKLLHRVFIQHSPILLQYTV